MKKIYPGRGRETVTVALAAMGTGSRGWGRCQQRIEPPAHAVKIAAGVTTMEQMGSLCSLQSGKERKFIEKPED